jgi:hypothetical protein
MGVLPIAASVLQSNSWTPPWLMVSSAPFGNDTVASWVVQLPLGQPASSAVAVGVVDGVEMLNVRLPFLISVPEIVAAVLALNSTLFCPGDMLPPGFLQLKVASAVAFSRRSTSPPPSPARDAVHVNSVALAVHVGSPPCLK